MNGARPLSIWHLLIGFALWSALFVGLYGLQGLGCELGWDGFRTGPVSLLRLLLVVGYAAGTAALVAVLILQLRRLRSVEGRSADFLVRAGALATVAGLVSTVLVFSPVLALSLCN